MLMRPILALLVYAVWVFLGGALLAPWIYAGVGWAARTLGWVSVEVVPFHRVVNRSLLGLALVGLWPWLHHLGIRKWHDLGLKYRRGEWRRLAAGFMSGFVSLACVAILALAFGARRFDLGHDAAGVGRHLVNAGLAAVVVGFLEELLFRGALFGGLRRAYAWPGALAASSVVYAMVHFLARPASPPSVTWYSGLAQLGEMASGFVDVGRVIPGFITLVLAGVILGTAYQRTGSLYFSIGLHAGWILWLKSYGFLTSESVAGQSWFWGSSRLIDGLAALPVLGVTLWFVSRYPIDNQENMR